MDLDSLQIRPGRVAAVDGALATLPAEPRRRVGLGGGALLSTVTVLLVGWNVGGVLAAALVGSLGGGVAYWLDDVVLRARTRRAATAASTLKVGHFEVLCSRDPATAEHELARWWDPAARPVSVERGESRPERAAHLRNVA